MKLILANILLLNLFNAPIATTKDELINLLLIKLQAKSIIMTPTSIECDQYGNMQVHYKNEKYPDQKAIFNLFDLETKIEQIEWVNGEKPYQANLFCETKCVKLINWGVGGSTMFTDGVAWNFYEQKDAEYVINCVKKIKTLCTVDPLK